MCPSVGQSVRQSVRQLVGLLVGPSVGPSVGRSACRKPFFFDEFNKDIIDLYVTDGQSVGWLDRRLLTCVFVCDGIFADYNSTWVVVVNHIFYNRIF